MQNLDWGKIRVYFKHNKILINISNQPKNGSFDTRFETPAKGLKENSPDGSVSDSSTGFPSRLGTSFSFTIVKKS